MSPVIVPRAKNNCESWDVTIGRVSVSPDMASNSRDWPDNASVNHKLPRLE